MTLLPPSREPHRHTFPPSRRIKLSGDFQKVYRLRASAANSRLLIYAAPNGRPLSRMGLSVGRKFGGSVQRNRAKRLLREAFRLTQRRLPEGYDFIMIPRNFEGLELVELLRIVPQLIQASAVRAVEKGGQKRPAAARPDEPSGNSPAPSEPPQKSEP